ncbi:MAG: hypothetical protein JW720_15220, partial [Sedimentisphaerales bacterium]|nr:hypothetical protein [Sedimentisphaerales bacterium]
QQCVGGAFWCSDNTSSTLDLCDGMDNDCDPSSPDGSEEAWVGQPCDGSDSDMCMEGTYECIGAAQTCTDYTGDTVELCDYLDNDCDGAVDEDFPEKGMPCNVGLGECLRHGTTVCSPDMTGLVCSATPGDPHPEICDGLDNDCDGYIDNGITCECYEDKDCGCWGSPIPCEAFGDPAMCFSQTGCQWISPYGCVSEPGHFPCESYGRGMCELQEGCYLEHCHDGECGP